MIRSMMLFASLMTATFAIIASGCCGPLGCGPGCGNISCSDCDGGFRQGIPAGGPISAARNLRRSAICGSGCGEAYIGEWISTPPDCQDPCCNGQFIALFMENVTAQVPKVLNLADAEAALALADLAEPQLPAALAHAKTT